MCVRAAACSWPWRRSGDRRGLAGRVQARLVRIITTGRLGTGPLRALGGALGAAARRAGSLGDLAAQLLDVVLHHLELTPGGLLTGRDPVHLGLELGEAPVQRLDVLLRPPERPTAGRLRSGRAATGCRRRWQRPASARASGQGQRRPPQAPAPRSRRPRRFAPRACGRPERPRREARRCAPGDRRGAWGAGADALRRAGVCAPRRPRSRTSFVSTLGGHEPAPRERKAWTAH